MKVLLCFSIGLLFCFSVGAQQSEDRIRHLRKRMVDKVEFVAGTGFSLNHGNMFVDNYRGEFDNGNYVENRRLAKKAYSLGIGAYHLLTNRVDLNVRLLWEQKGYRSELNTTLGPASRAFAKSDYDYFYMTIPIVVRLHLGEKCPWGVSIGGYISQLIDVKATEYFNNTLNNSSSVSSFFGRTLVAFDDNGGVNQVAFIPGLQGFARYDFGATVAANCRFKITERHNLECQLGWNFGLANVNAENATALPAPREYNLTALAIISYVYHRSAKY